ncbi:PIN domain-like protein, partial [Metschnikowia bicuspidata var. bicuspidata NRRL YB-4993]
MGIDNLWEILPLDDRVSFPVFLSRFIQKNGRPPRLAIDAYMFMFWSLVSNVEEHDPVKESYDIRNFMAKLWYLAQTNVSFVVVFDGAHKPRKLRHGNIPQTPGSESYDEQLESFLKLHRSKFSERLRLVETLKDILSRNRINWEQAPAEAEAQCAWNQRLGVVDYVISDDSDTLVFGATGVLRWFTRVKYYTDNKEPVNSPTDYYVTPVHMSHVTKQTNLERNHLVFIAVLRGGDYSRGAESIGITRAKELALCGTTMLQKKARATAQDFGSFVDLTKLFVDTFVLPEKGSKILLDPYFGRKEVGDRHLSLIAFNSFLNQFLKEKASQVFGRVTKFEGTIQIDDYFAMLYFFPLVNTRVFKFTPHSTSFAEASIVAEDLSGVKIDSEVMRYNNVVSSTVIGKLTIKNGVEFFEQYLELHFEKTALPRERKYNLKAFVLKLLRNKIFWNYIQFARIKDFEGVSMAVLKFNRVKLNEFVYYTRKDLTLELEVESERADDSVPNEGATEANTAEPEEDDDKSINLTVPLESVKFVSPEFVKKFNYQAQRKSPAKKKKQFQQKTTLDSL